MGVKKLITLTTDFGSKSPFVGVMKGVILSRFADVEIVDLSHEIEGYHGEEAGFWLQRICSYFPSGTIHIVVVDPGVGTDRDIILCKYKNQIFLAPDNGIIHELLKGQNDYKFYKLLPESYEKLGISEISATFHGRDIFAPLAAEIAAENVQIEDLAAVIYSICLSSLPSVKTENNKVTGTIVSVDSFGNLISNIEAAHVKAIVQPIITIQEHKFAMKETYGAAKPGEYIGLINSLNVLEVAKVQGNANVSLGINHGALVTVQSS